MTKTRNRGGPESGNALLYILIAIILFSALSFMMGRQADQGGNVVSKQQASILAAELMDYAANARQVVDQMVYTGSDLNDITFERFNDGAFNTAPHFNKIFHPQGGGLVIKDLPEKAIGSFTADPPPGWYIGKFNNFEWTRTGAQDIVLVGYKLSADVCGQINEDLTGSATIPASSEALRNILIDDLLHTGTNVADFTSAHCADCWDTLALCIQSGGLYGFYSLIGGQ